MRERRYFVYLLASRPRGVLYIGVTNDLTRRRAEHAEAKADSFTRRYQVKKLVWFEEFSDIRDAIAREKQLKGWRRKKKDALIEKMNPRWEELLGDWS